VEKKIAILYGGTSSEREVSLRTGKAVSEALQAKPYRTLLIDVDKNIIEKLKEEKPDVAIISLHGRYGEDGCIQGVLEILGIPFTGPGVMASSIAMNKIMTKKILVFEGIPTPDFMVLNGTQSPDDMADQIIKRFKTPLVVKAANQGSSIGVCFAFNEDDVRLGLNECLKYDTDILVEQFIKGRELTVSVIGNSDPIVLPVLEIVSPTGVYDYHAKYTAGASDHFVADLPADTANIICDLAIKTYKAIGCEGLSRIDFLLTEENKPYVLEVNTSPGMTATSLFPDAARAAGINFPDLVEKIINYALEAHSQSE
jgi:D-alanine-D-alanine ligase